MFTQAFMNTLNLRKAQNFADKEIDILYIETLETGEKGYNGEYQGKRERQTPNLRNVKARTSFRRLDEGVSSQRH